MRPETIKLLDKNMGSMLFDIGISNVFLDLCFQTRETKAKINKWDLVKIKSFCIVQETIYKTKRQPTEWEKICVKDIFNQRLISKIFFQERHTDSQPTH